MFFFVCGPGTFSGSCSSYTSAGKAAQRARLGEPAPSSTAAEAVSASGAVAVGPEVVVVADVSCCCALAASSATACNGGSFKLGTVVRKPADVALARKKLGGWVKERGGCSATTATKGATTRIARDTTLDRAYIHFTSCTPRRLSSPPQLFLFFSSWVHSWGTLKRSITLNR